DAGPQSEQPQRGLCVLPRRPRRPPDASRDGRDAGTAFVVQDAGGIAQPARYDDGLQRHAIVDHGPDPARPAAGPAAAQPGLPRRRHRRAGALATIRLMNPKPTKCMKPISLGPPWKCTYKG